MYKESIEKIKPELDKVVQFFKREVQRIRSGKANPSLVEDLLVDCFDSKIPLKQLAAISCPEPRQILIQPWSAEYSEAINKALHGADLGTSPVNDGQVFRINLPPVTGEFREKLIVQVSRKSEEALQTIRRWRDEAWKEIQNKFHQKEISEDDKFKGKDELQEVINEYQEKIEGLREKKKKEIGD